AEAVSRFTEMSALPGTVSQHGVGVIQTTGRRQAGWLTARQPSDRQIASAGRCRGRKVVEFCLLAREAIELINLSISKEAAQKTLTGRLAAHQPFAASRKRGGIIIDGGVSEWHFVLFGS